MESTQISETWHFSLYFLIWSGKGARDCETSTACSWSGSSLFSSCAVFQMTGLWSITRKSSCHLVRFHFLEISRCWLTEQTCLHNVLVAMCLGDVPICHCWHNSDGAFKCWDYENVTWLDLDRSLKQTTHCIYFAAKRVKQFHLQSFEPSW